MTAPHPDFHPRAALACFILALTAAGVGFFSLPFVPGYFALAVVAGGLNAIGWIIVVKTDGRSATGYFGLIATVILNIVAKDHLPPGDSRSFGYAVVFVSVAVAIGLGVALLYRESRKRRALQPTAPCRRSHRG